MVKKRQVATDVIPELRFRPPVGTPPGIEVMTLRALSTRVDREHLDVARRPSFHHLIAPRSGSLVHTVDFTDHRVSAGEWLWVRPHQVHRWGDIEHADGVLVLFRDDFLDPAAAAATRLGDPYASVVLRPSGTDGRLLADLAALLSRAWRAVGRLPVDVHAAVLRHHLAALLLSLAHLPADADAPASPHTSAFVRFRDAVERDFARSRRLEDYARELGYSTRTLSRATQASSGVGGKTFIDRRVLLEARRLLAHTDLPADQIATELGFTSATNFGAYFRQRTGLTPIAFRASQRAPGRGEGVPGPPLRG